MALITVLSLFLKYELTEFSQPSLDSNYNPEFYKLKKKKKGKESPERLTDLPGVTKLLSGTAVFKSKANSLFIAFYYSKCKTCGSIWVS